MNKNLKNIFLINEGQILDLSTWEFYKDKADVEKGYFSKYYKTNFENQEISIGVFYKLNKKEEIHHIAWGIKTEKDCSYNATVKDNLYIENIISGCPCDELKAVKKNIFIKYKKYLPIFIFLTLTVLFAFILQFLFGDTIHSLLNFYMASFFLVFGSLKFVNTKKFAMSFKKYDPIAKRIEIYAKIYPCIEIILGLAFLFQIQLFLASILTILILLPTTFGIIQALNKKQNLQCGCLGGFFNVPISWITVIENLVMIFMSLAMLILFYI